MKSIQSPLFIVPDGQEHSLKLVTPSRPTILKPPPVRTSRVSAPPPRPTHPCFTCHSRIWWLLDGIAWRCGACHPTLAVADLRWRMRRRPIRFTVASHHWRKTADWLADPHAFTIMAWPPTKYGWPASRNIALLAPTSDILNAYRDHDITAAGYTEQFNDLMNERLTAIVALLTGYLGQHITLLCACNSRSLDERFCHAHLVARVLVWLGCEQVAWEATARQEASPTPQAIPSAGRIYVDELVGWGVTPAPGAARHFGNGKQSCHLATDDHSEAGLEELHQFAKKIGMQRRWFQDHRVMPHYDLTPSKRILAVKAGAVEVRPTDLVRICGREAWEERQEARAA
jgi:hypothetical protein